MPNTVRLPRADAEELSRALSRNFTSPNVYDSNGEPANVVDVLEYIAGAIHHLAEAHERFTEVHDRGLAVIAQALLAANEEGDK